MEESAMVGLIIGIIVLVIIIIAFLVFGVWLWKRRHRRALIRRTTTRPTSSMVIASDTINASTHDYRLSLDMLSLPAGIISPQFQVLNLLSRDKTAGDRNGSVNEVTGQNPNDAVAPPPPIGVAAPPRRPV